MSSFPPAQVLKALGLRATDSADPPQGGMSGSTLTDAVTGAGEHVVVKVSPLHSDAARGRAHRELAVYRDLASEYALPTPRLVAHHQTADWLAIALTRDDPAPPAPDWTTDDWGTFARTLARLHRDVPPLPHRSEPEEPQQDRDTDPKAFAARLWHAPGDPDRIDTVLDDLGPLNEAARSGPVTFVHGDCHTGNVLRSADRQPMLVDWQSAGTGPAAADLAFAFTRAVPTGAAVPREHSLAAYCDEAGADAARTDRQVTAHQLLILVRQYPEFAAFLGRAEVERLRVELDHLIGRWTDCR